MRSINWSGIKIDVFFFFKGRYDLVGGRVGVVVLGYWVNLERIYGSYMFIYIFCV